MTTAELIDVPAPCHFVKAADDYLPGWQNLPGFIAGGFIRSIERRDCPNDIDLFFADDKDRSEAYRMLLADGWHAEGTGQIATTLTNGQDERIVQLCVVPDITDEFGIIAFDFVCVCAALLPSPDGPRLVMHPEALTDARFGVLRTLTLDSPMHTLRRVADLLDRGYTIAGAELANIASAIEERSEFPIDKWDCYDGTGGDVIDDLDAWDPFAA